MLGVFWLFHLLVQDPSTSWNSCGSFLMFMSLAGIVLCPASIALLARWLPSRTYFRLLWSSTTMRMGYCVSAVFSLSDSMPPLVFLIIIFSMLLVGMLYVG